MLDSGSTAVDLLFPMEVSEPTATGDVQRGSSLQTLGSDSQRPDSKIGMLRGPTDAAVADESDSSHDSVQKLDFDVMTQHMNPTKSLRQGSIGF